MVTLRNDGKTASGPTAINMIEIKPLAFPAIKKNLGMSFADSQRGASAAAAEAPQWHAQLVNRYSSARVENTEQAFYVLAGTTQMPSPSFQFVPMYPIEQVVYSEGPVCVHLNGNRRAWQSAIEHAKKFIPSMN